MDILGYRNKRVIVSGCFSGMGRATAELLLELGAEVHGLDYKETDLQLSSFTQVDLREPKQIDAAVCSIGGRVHALFNCAGLPQTSPPLDVMKVNFMGTRYLTEKVAALMDEGAAIASISSTGGLGWSQHMPVLMELIALQTYDEQVAWCEANMDKIFEGYAFSKEAIIVWTMLSGAHLIKQGIRINCTLPAPTQTPMMKHFIEGSGQDVVDAATQPSGRYSTPEEQAGGLVLLNSDLAGFVNGVAFPVDGGFMGGVATGQVDLSVMLRQQQES